jgi:hypothetical protein
MKPRKIENLNDVKVRTENGNSENKVITSPSRPTESKTVPEKKPQINNNPVNENPKPVVTEKPVEQTQRVFPTQKQRVPDTRSDVDREKNNNLQQSQSNQQTIKQPPGINNQSSNKRIIRQPNENQEKPGRIITPPPGNRQPVKTEQPKTVPQQNTPQKNFRQENQTPAYKNPVIRNQNPINPQQKERPLNLQKQTEKVRK